MFTHRTLAWLAFVAAFTAAIGPFAAKLIPLAATSSVLFEICSPDGSRFVESASDNEDAPADHRESARAHHCPLCSVHGGMAALPSGPYSFPLQAGTHRMPVLFYRATARLHAWVSAQPRAPPALS